MSGRPNSDQKVYTVKYADGSWYKYKLHEDNITFQSESTGQTLTKDTVFEFGALVDSYFRESDPKIAGRSPPKATFYDGMLGFGPADDEHNKMMTVMDSIIDEDMIRFPSLTFFMDEDSTQDKAQYKGTMIFGHPPDYYANMHGPIPIEKLEGTVGIHLHNAEFVDAFHRKIEGATNEYGAWAFPSKAHIPTLGIQTGTSNSPYIEVPSYFLLGEPVHGTDLCWSRLHKWHKLLNRSGKPPAHVDIIGMAAIASLTLMYQFDTSTMTTRYERTRYVNLKGKEVNTHGNHIYWEQSWAHKTVDSSH
ncbi:hypothetical protein C0995_003850 [Termitomyces sp. Mi166|nr:hypothetical protein C0995_003850 [Termitomyces sp. Mi166\